MKRYVDVDELKENIDNVHLAHKSDFRAGTCMVLTEVLL